MKLTSKDKSHWKNLCGHPDNSFIGSICIQTADEMKWYDVYVYKPQDNSVQHVCVRTGNGHADFYTVGRLSHLIQNNIYKRSLDNIILDFLMEKGNFIFEKGN